jgi:hypothetical protein
LALRISEEELKPVPSKGWAAMIRKVYEVNPMLCPKCGGTMKAVAFLTIVGWVNGNKDVPNIPPRPSQPKRKLLSLHPGYT